MNKILYFITVFITFFFAAIGARAQYSIVSHTAQYNALDTSSTACHSANIEVRINAYTPTLTLKTYFGDGTSHIDPVVNGPSYGLVQKSHDYPGPGTYAIKYVLFNDVTALDSAVGSVDILSCNQFIVGAYKDLNLNCSMDTSSEPYYNEHMKFEVKKNGVVVDTFASWGKFIYRRTGTPGTVYTFRFLPVPSTGLSVFCTGADTVTDTVYSNFQQYRMKLIPVMCTPTPSVFDVSEVVYGRPVISGFASTILVSNDNCIAQNITLVMHYSPKYQYVSASPLPASVTGNTITWNLTNVASYRKAIVSVRFNPPSIPLIAGDTIHTDYTVTTGPGDVNPANNYIFNVDTIRASLDPNSKEVSPAGDIAAGTKLTYTIHFENTGNGTAFNVHVMDTLSDNLDMESFQVIASSASMNVYKLNFLGHNIIKFDFPNINLLDSSHHGENTGMFVYTINAKPGLPPGTKIRNRAGIYFDYNDVVMTNTVQNQIPLPGDVQHVNKVKAEIYPNPVSTELTINTTNEFSSVTITNTIGQVMQKRSLNSAQSKVDVHTLPPGLYFLILRGNDGVKVQQFQKL